MTTTHEQTTVAHSAAGGTEAQMHAITQYRYGTAEVLTLDNVSVPTPDQDEVLIEVVAAGVDRGTCHLMSGTPYLIRLAGFGFTKPKNRVPGLDVAGRVVAIGTGVTRFVPGDEVSGLAVVGGLVLTSLRSGVGRGAGECGDSNHRNDGPGCQRSASDGGSQAAEDQ